VILLRRGLRSLGSAFALAIILAATTGVLAGEATSPPSHTPDALVGSTGWRAHATADDPRDITIIESQSENASHTMDVRWQELATEMGHTATIVAQSALDDIANLEGTDILIVSSGIIELTPGRVQTIRAFVEDYGPAYLQGEYLPTYTSNLAFQEIIGAFGGSFTISGTVAGHLEPMNVLGVLGTQPNVVPTIPYFWYGCAGGGDDTVEPFLEYGGDYFGWIFTDQRGGGTLIQTTDQDWVIQSFQYPDCEALMQNIIAYLDEHTETAIDESTWGAIKQLYR
jgi:hypothetical protein